MIQILRFMLSCTVFAHAATELVKLEGHVFLRAAQSPYLVNRSLVLSMKDTLTVEPGVEIRIQGYQKVILRGAVQIAGTAKKPVRILAADSSESWVGLHLSPGNNRTEIRGLEVHNAFRNTFRGVQGVISGSTFSNNYYALWIEESPSLQITDCRIEANRYGLTVSSDSLRLEKTTITQNVFGVWLEGSARISPLTNQIQQNQEANLSTPSDSSRQTASGRISKHALQMVEARF